VRDDQLLRVDSPEYILGILKAMQFFSQWVVLRNTSSAFERISDKGISKDQHVGIIQNRFVRKRNTVAWGINEFFMI
jgi:hypothetical protein